MKKTALIPLLTISSLLLASPVLAGPKKSLMVKIKVQLNARERGFALNQDCVAQKVEAIDGDKDRVIIAITGRGGAAAKAPRTFWVRAQNRGDTTNTENYLPQMGRGKTQYTITGNYEKLAIEDHALKSICKGRVKVNLRGVPDLAKPAPPPEKLKERVETALDDGEIMAKLERRQRYTKINDTARDFLRKKLKQADHQAKGWNSRVYRLYHLPDGSPAFPVPMHITERDKILISVARPPGAHTDITVSSCEKVPSFRIIGSLAETRALLKKLTPLMKSQNLREEGDYSKYRLKSAIHEVQCSGALTYKITTTLFDGTTSSTVTTINIDPVYHLAWGVALTFDFGQQKNLSLKDRLNAKKTATEKFISSESEYSGVRPLILVGLYPFGANPHNWRVMDWFSPFIGVDPSRIDEGFMWGLSICPLPGVGLAVGMSVYASEELDDNATAAGGTPLQPGDAYTAIGDLPTKKVFNGDSVGGFIGISLTTEAFKALFGN